MPRPATRIRNKDMDRLNRALEAVHAITRPEEAVMKCTANAEAQRAVRVYLQSWVEGPLSKAILSIRGDEKEDWE